MPATSRRPVRGRRADRVPAARCPRTTSSSVAGRPGPAALATSAAAVPSGSGNRPTRPSTVPSIGAGRRLDDPVAGPRLRDRHVQQHPPAAEDEQPVAGLLDVGDHVRRTAARSRPPRGPRRPSRAGTRAARAGRGSASGSSSSRTGARVPSAIASPTCACWPPESSSAAGVRAGCPARRGAARRRRGRSRRGSARRATRWSAHRQLAVERRGLGHVPDLADRAAAVLPRVDARRPASRPVVGPLEPDVALDQRRLAGAVRARRAP